MYFLILTLKSLCNVHFFEILAILRPKLAENHHFGVTYFLTLYIEARKSSIHTTSYWYFFKLNDKIGTSLYFKTTWTTVSYSYWFLEPLQDWR